MKIKQPIFSLVCHDAGAANILIAFIKQKKLVNSVQCYLEGPAKKIWQKTFPRHKICENLEECLVDASFLLAGTGWASDLEFNAISIASQKGIKTVSAIDHWVNYCERFERDGLRRYPDEIWVFDECALKLAVQQFPDITIKLKVNYYLENAVDGVHRLRNTKNMSINLLYLLEPIRMSWPKSKLGEFEALDYFFLNLKSLNIPSNTKIILRPHPSEDPKKYVEWAKPYLTHNVVIDTSHTLEELLACAKWVVGCESYSMVIALSLGAEVYCSLPPWAPPPRLPFGKIIRISQIAEAI